MFALRSLVAVVAAAALGSDSAQAFQSSIPSHRKPRFRHFRLEIETSSSFYPQLLESEVKRHTKEASFKAPGPLDQLNQSLIARSRPARKPVSMHSTIGMLTTGVFLGLLCSLFSFARYPNGMLEILSTFRPLSADRANTTFFSLFMFAVCGVLGIFRLPQNTPEIRRTSFMSFAATNVHLFLVGCSSLNIAGYHWFDAFTPIGKLVLASSGAWFLVTYCKFFHAAVTTDKKGASTMTGVGTLPSRVLTSLMMMAGMTVFLLVLAPLVTSSLAEYTTSVTTPVAKLGLSSFYLMSALTASATCGFAALVATLKFEKRIKPAVGTLVNLALAIILNYDASVSTSIFLAGNFASETMFTLNGVFLRSFQKTKILPLLSACLLGTITHGFYVKFLKPQIGWNRRRQRQPELAHVV